MHLTVIAYQRYTFPCDGLLPTLPSFMCVEPLWKGKSPGNNQWEREELNLHCLPRGNRFTACRYTANSSLFPRMESLTVLHPPSMQMSLSLTKVRQRLSIVLSANHVESNHSPVTPCPLLLIRNRTVLNGKYRFRTCLCGFSVHRFHQISLLPLTVIRRLAAIFFVPCIALSGF